MSSGLQLVAEWLYGRGFARRFAWSLLLAVDPEQARRSACVLAHFAALDTDRD